MTAAAISKRCASVSPENHELTCPGCPALGRHVRDSDGSRTGPFAVRHACGTGRARGAMRGTNTRSCSTDDGSEVVSLGATVDDDDIDLTVECDRWSAVIEWRERGEIAIPLGGLADASAVVIVLDHLDAIELVGQGAPRLGGADLAMRSMSSEITEIVTCLDARRRVVARRRR